MPLPHTFLPDTIASSAEVNDNFSYLAAIFGIDSTSDAAYPPGPLVMGPRKNQQLYGGADTSPNSSTSFWQVGWNAELYYDEGKHSWHTRRFHDGEAATMMRLGRDGFAVHMTSATAGDLSSQLTPRVFALKATKSTPNKDYMYLKRDWAFTHVDQEPSNIGDRRLTLVALTTPVTLYNGAFLSKTTKTHTATDYGIPAEAVAIQITVEGISTDDSPARLRFYEDRADRSIKYGFSVWSPVAGTGAAGQGMVRLGTGAYDHRFVEERTAAWDSASVFISAYWI